MRTENCTNRVRREKIWSENRVIKVDSFEKKQGAKKMLGENMTPKRIFNTKMELHELFGMRSLMHNTPSYAMEFWIKEFFFRTLAHTHKLTLRMQNKQMAKQKRTYLSLSMFSRCFLCALKPNKLRRPERKLFKIKWAEQKTSSVCGACVCALCNGSDGSDGDHH